MQNETNVYLSDSVQFEPLVNGWYAWGYLISPATAAMVTSNLHLRVLDSYLKRPELHQKAVKNSALKGGMYIDSKSSIEEIKALYDFTLTHLKDRKDFADGVKQLDTLLDNKTDGMTLTELYEHVPDVLKGYVELVYDLRNRPSFRFIENLLYHSPFYDDSLQSICLTHHEMDERPFVLSSPRLAGEGSLMFNMPFASRQLDDLFSMRHTPLPLGEIKERFNFQSLSDEHQALFLSLFSDIPPRAGKDNNYAGDDVRVRYYGHATVLVETSDVTILTDPVVSYETGEDVERFTLNDLPDKIDYVVLTHNHQDHVMFETLLQIRHKIGCIIVPKCAIGLLQDPSLKLMLERVGFTNVVELDEMQNLDVPGGQITGIPFFGEHADLDIRTKLAYAVKLKGRSMLFLADSNALEIRMYEKIRDVIGDIDAIFIGLECTGAPLSWLYGPLYTKPIERKVDQSRRLNSSACDSALQIIDTFNPSQVYIYAMGLEPWLGYISSIEYTKQSEPIVQSDLLLKVCEERALTSKRLFLKDELIFPAK
ncbi:MBL fold metallo-hydrolase [Pseudoalteromonas piscicida]|uniref:MBL fold metallo-hydrolase n=1 Tax=Pseudoalteromonas piscicida TaxID=43662 RepID=UPI00309E4287